ncbi:hypothetical protein D8B46_00260 [Candidatus Gracilibacteria bacterium]|nr:MAG: hypothetical protein D8B46_00260 [Candidatus Gracilibacteria bacterium]
MKKNKDALSLVIAIGLVLISSLLALTILEYIIPFSKSVTGMENSSKAYYLANSGLEQGLYDLVYEESQYKSPTSPKKPTEIPSKYFNEKFETYDDEEISKTKLKSTFLEIQNIGQIEPEPGQGESEFDKDYNIINVGKPIQMDIKGINPDTLKISFKVPEINNQKMELIANGKPFISWQLTSKNGFINSDEINSLQKDKIIEKDNNPENKKIIIGNLGKTTGKIYFSNPATVETGKSLSDAYQKLGCQSNSCILKFSVVNILSAKLASVSSSADGISLPYLEWKLENTEKFRKRYADIKSEGKSNGYVKRLEIKAPQTTVNEAFNFTVFQ